MKQLHPITRKVLLTPIPRLTHITIIIHLVNNTINTRVSPTGTTTTIHGEAAITIETTVAERMKPIGIPKPIDFHRTVR